MIVFQNEGLIDFRAISTFGVSAKVGESPIGFFGTGLKYAIACVLRAGGQINIWRGMERHEFVTMKETIRDKEFDLAGVIDYDKDGQRLQEAPDGLGFTTHLGKHWEAWQAFRELYCNTIDEGGSTECTPGVLPAPGLTTIMVEGWPDFETAFRNRDKIVLPGEPAYSCPAMQVFRGHSVVAYYRRVRVHDLQNASHFTYNLTASSITLTEDRTLKYNFELAQAIGSMVTQSNDREFIEEWLTSPKDSFENTLDLTRYCTAPSETFLDMVQYLRTDFSRPLNQSALTVLRNARASAWALDEFELDEVELQQYKDAIELINALGFHLSQEVPVRFVQNLGPGVYGRALMVERQILISKKAFDVGTKCLAGTLMEEHLHVEHGMEDESRTFQNFLIDKLMSLAAKHILKKAL